MRYINIIGEIDNDLIKDVLQQLYKIEQEDNKIEQDNLKLVNKDDYKKLEDLTINITTSGGYNYGFYAIWDIIKRLKCKIITRTYGKCMSCGLWLLLMGDERYSGEYTNFLFHRMSYEMEGKIKNHKSYQEFQEKCEEKMLNFIVERTNITREMLDKYILGEWWFDYEEAVKLGIINKTNE
jgi:ATP-dependent Clp protease protease subunit